MLLSPCVALGMGTAVPSAACGPFACFCAAAWRRTLSAPAPQEAINPLAGTLERCCGFSRAPGELRRGWEVAPSPLAAGTLRSGSGIGARRTLAFSPLLLFRCPLINCPCKLQPASPKSCFDWGQGSGVGTKAKFGLSLPAPPVGRSVPLPTQLSARAAPGFGVSSGQPGLVWPLPAWVVKAWPR